MRRVWKDRLQTLLFLSVLITAAAWTGWLTLRQVKPMFEKRVQAPLKHEPDYIIEQFSMVRVSKTGQTVTQMHAPKLTHYPDDDSADILEPRITARSEDGSSTTDVVAATGKILRGGEEVQLSGNVVLTRRPVAPAEVMQLNTEYLQVFPDTEIMQTNLAAKGSRGATRFEAPGFIVDNGQRTTEMKGPGHIVLAPKGS